MNTPIMCGYLAVVDKHCVGRKCMLLLDNFSAHNASEDWMNDEGGLNNLKIIFFPLIGITAYQTLDQGIIPGFRAQYHRFFLAYCCDKWPIQEDPIKTINIRHIIQWAVKGWRVVTKVTIKKYWKHLTLIDFPDSQVDTCQLSYLSGEDRLIQELNQARKTISIQDLLDPADEVAENTVEDIEELILQTYNKDFLGEGIDFEEEAINQSLVLHQEGFQFICDIIKYEEHQGHIDLDLFKGY